MSRRAGACAALLLGLLLCLHALTGVTAATAPGQVTVGFTVVPGLSLSLATQGQGVLAAVTSSTCWAMGHRPGGGPVVAGPATMLPRLVRFRVNGEQELIWTLVPR